MKTAILASALGLSLAACTSIAPSGPRPEQAAFEKLSAEIGYANPHIDYNAGGCAIYEATGPNGENYREPLRGENDMPICYAR